MSAPRGIGVIFDMDGVLVDSAAPHWESWRLLAKEEGTTVREQRFWETFGRPSADVVPALFGPVSPADLKRLSDRKEAIYRDLVGTTPPIVPGAGDLVRALRDHGVRVAIGSSGPPENVELVAKALGKGAKFDATVTADDVKRGKPHPDVFAITADRLGLPAERCVVIEDAPVGVEAARAAGCRCIGVTIYQPKEALDAADLLVRALADVRVEDVVKLVTGSC